MNFHDAQRAWEATWIDGPPDDPREQWLDWLESTSDESLLALFTQSYDDLDRQSRLDLDMELGSRNLEDYL